MTKLTYFDFSGSRGEECRLALHLAGVPFEDVRIRSDWPALKEQTPYGTLPVLELDDHRTLSQSNAILVYLGREHGLHPRDNWLAARHEELMAAVEDLRGVVGPTTRIADPAEKQKAREELASGYLKRWGRSVDRRLAELGPGPFAAGDTINVADLKLYIVARWFSSGVLDHIPSDVFAEFPRIVALHRAVAEHPKVLAWQARSQQAS